MKLNKLVWLGLTLVTLGTSAQFLPPDPDWKEIEAPPPPAFSTDRLIPIEMPRYVSLRFGVDPATIAVTSDGIVRYVMVASNASGSTTAMYEGLRCASGEVKTYARYSANGQWHPVLNPEWQGLDNNLPSKHALALAKQGVCEGRTLASYSAATLINVLKYPKTVY